MALPPHARLLGRIDPTEPLLVAALEVEIAALRDVGLPILVTGLGSVAAAVSVATTVARDRPREIISLGTCGALRDDVTGTLIVRRVLQHDIDTELLQGLIGFDAAPVRDLQVRFPGATAVLATGDVFVSDEAARRTLAERADIVDMEGYAVATAASALEVPCTLVKCVSDTADGQAARSWTQTMQHCAEQLGEWVRTHVR